MSDGDLLVHLLSALGAALVGGAVALRLRQPVIVGFLLAGVAIGPFTPGMKGSVEAISQLAELGIVFLLFVIGVQLSLRELVRAGRIAVAGGLAQVAILIGIGYLVGRALGWGHLEAYVFGAVISNSSSTVLGKILGDRGELDSAHGRIGIAWSSVQDLSTVVLVAVLAALTPGARSGLGMLAEAAIFFFVLVPLAFLVLPSVLRRATVPRSRELFVLAVVTAALLMAWGASMLGVSLALGAFLAGIVVGESDLSHRILGDAMPLRDLFAGVFFVSIGMMLDPWFVVERAPLVLLTVALIIVVKGTVVALIARAAGATTRLAVLVGCGLAQSGEFSFLLARVGADLGAIGTPVFQLLLSAAAVSVLLAPLVDAAVPALFRRVQRARARPTEEDGEEAPPSLAGHAVVVGHGRVGRLVCSLLERHGLPFVVIEEDLRIVDELRARGVHALFGDAAQPHVLDRAHLRSARLLALCVPERVAALRAAEHAREVGGGAIVIARVHRHEDGRLLEARGVTETVFGETELALELGRRALTRLGVDGAEIERSIELVRRAAG